MTPDYILQEILKVEPLATIFDTTDADGDRWLEWAMPAKRLGFICGEGYVGWYFSSKETCKIGTLVTLDLPLLLASMTETDIAVKS